MLKLIGGFFALENDKQFCASLINAWQINTSILMQNARSCLALLIKLKKIKKIWLPAYCCDSIISALDIPFDYYPLDKALKCDLDFLRNYLNPLDAVFVIDYFGRPQDTQLIEFVSNHPKNCWIEDRAQTLIVDHLNWADYIIYSPRKLFGVADGGILVSEKHDLPQVKLSKLQCEHFNQAQTLRALQPDANQLWYPHYQQQEQAMNVSEQAMSEQSKQILSSINIEKIKKIRQENYHYLAKQFSEHAFLGLEIDFVPFGFMMKIANVTRVTEKCHQQNLFVARHWINLKSPKNKFKHAHELSEMLMTVPCDQRYDLNDMEQVAKIIKESI